MKITTKIVLALALVGSVVLTSCKDNDEDNYTNAMLSTTKLTEAFKQQITALEAEIQAAKDSKCSCSTTLKADILSQAESMVQDAIATLKTSELGSDGTTDPVTLNNIADKMKDMNQTAAEVKSVANRDSTVICMFFGAANLSEALNTLADKSNTLSGVQQALKDSCTSLLTNITSVAKDVKANADAISELEKAYIHADSVLGKRIDSLVVRLDSLEDARAKQVTGIVVQQVWNPAFGSYNGIVTNLQSDMLVAYYGSGASAEHDIFPYEFSDRKESCPVPTDYLMNEGDNAGKLYVTINPNTVNFDGLSNCLSLVNSLDEASAMKIGELKKSSELLTLGYTRADAGNGLYEAGVSLSKKDLVNDLTGAKKMHITVDASAYKTAAKEIISSGTRKQGLKDMAVAIANTLKSANSLEANAVKCSWTDMYSTVEGTHAVYSQYGIATLAVKPLGFNSVDGIFAEGGKYWQGVDKAKQFITNAADQLATTIKNAINGQLDLSKLKADIKDIQIIKLEAIDASKLNFKVTVKLDQYIYIKADVNSIGINMDEALKTMYLYADASGKLYYFPEDPGAGYTKVTLKALEDAGKINVYVKDGQKLIDVTQSSTERQDLKRDGYEEIAIKINETIDMTDKLQPLIDKLNSSFGGINGMMSSLDKLKTDAVEMLNKVDSLEAKISGKVISDKIIPYLDKVAKKVADYTPRLFKPTLLVNSDKGFGFCGFSGHNSKVKGKVTILPTTWSNELLAPVFKKYIRVREKNTTDPLLEKIYEGADQAGKSIDLENLMSGKTYTIDYGALDFTGAEISESYEITVE